MARARLTADWNRTSSVLAMLFNVNRGKGVSPKSAKDFNPLAPKQEPVTLTREEAKAALERIAASLRR